VFCNSPKDAHAIWSRTQSKEYQERNKLKYEMKRICMMVKSIQIKADSGSDKISAVTVPMLFLYWQFRDKSQLIWENMKE